jgi:hypothetical protein
MSRARHLIIVACIVVAAAVPAGAQTATTGPARAQQLALLKARGDAEIARRITTLDQLAARMSTSRHITDADRTRLTNETSTEKAGLTSLKAKIDADTDLATLRQDLHRIVVDFRVYVLVVPQVHLTGAADAALSAADRLAAISTRLQTLLDQAATAGNDGNVLRSQLADANAKIAAAKQLAGPLPDKLAVLTPSGYPGNRDVLVSARDALRTARSDLRSARDSIRQVVSSLRPARTTTTT